MRLRYSATSPFVRKVWIFALETGLAEDIEFVATNPWAPDTDLPSDNPIGKVPTLIADDGSRCYDSPVICEYLDSLHQGATIPDFSSGAMDGLAPPGARRWHARRCGH